MVTEERDSLKHGSLFPTDRVHIIAVLIARGHNVHKYTLDQRGRVVAWFPRQEDGKPSVESTLTDFRNYDLNVDAKKLVDSWMELRDMIRNKEFSGGAAKTC